jgi:hypothetical protein
VNRTLHTASVVDLMPGLATRARPGAMHVSRPADAGTCR